MAGGVNDKLEPPAKLSGGVGGRDGLHLQGAELPGATEPWAGDRMNGGSKDHENLIGT